MGVEGGRAGGRTDRGGVVLMMVVVVVFVTQWRCYAAVTPAVPHISQLSSSAAQHSALTFTSFLQ